MNYFYINTQTMEYPLYEGDVRLMYPDIAEVFRLPKDGVFAQVNMRELPICNRKTQEYVFETPEFVDGLWWQTVSVRDLTDAEIKIQQDYLDSIFPKSEKQVQDLSKSGSAPNVIE